MDYIMKYIYKIKEGLLQEDIEDIEDKEDNEYIKDIEGPLQEDKEDKERLQLEDKERFQQEAKEPLIYTTKVYSEIGDNEIGNYEDYNNINANINKVILEDDYYMNVDKLKKMLKLFKELSRDDKILYMFRIYCMVLKMEEFYGEDNLIIRDKNYKLLDTIINKLDEINNEVNFVWYNDVIKELKYIRTKKLE